MLFSCMQSRPVRGTLAVTRPIRLSTSRARLSSVMAAEQFLPPGKLETVLETVALVPRGTCHAVHAAWHVARAFHSPTSQRRRHRLGHALWCRQRPGLGPRWEKLRAGAPKSEGLADAKTKTGPILRYMTRTFKSNGSPTGL